MTTTVAATPGRLWTEALGLVVLFLVMQILGLVVAAMAYGLYLYFTGADLATMTEQKGIVIAIVSLPFSVALTLFFARLMLRRRGLGWRDLGLSKPASVVKTVLYGIGIAIIATLAAAGVSIGLEKLGHVQDLSAFNFLPGNTIMFIFMATVISWFAAGFAEEFIFRGFVMGNIAKALGGHPRAWAYAAVIQALIFGLFHAYQGLNGVVSTGVIGLIFGLFYCRFRNLWPLVVAHGALDTFGMTMLYLNIDVGF